MTCVNTHCFECVNNLIESGGDVNHGYTQLGIADVNGHCGCVNKLVEAGADVNGRGGNGETPLIAAAVKGHEKCVDALIKAGADVNARINNYYSLILREVKSGSRLRSDLDILGEFSSPNEGETALILAAQNGHSACVELLVDAGADVNAADIVGRTPLIATANVSDRLRIMPHSVTTTSRILRPYADKSRCVQLLLRAGARVNVTYEHGLNALECHFALSECRDRRVVKLLLTAAGEVLTRNIISKKSYWGESIGCTQVSLGGPDGEGLSLKQLCREAVRGHLLQTHPLSNLFQTVGRLGLPVSLAEYLLNSMSLDVEYQ